MVALTPVVAVGSSGNACGEGGGMYGCDCSRCDKSLRNGFLACGVLVVVVNMDAGLVVVVADAVVDAVVLAEAGVLSLAPTKVGTQAS